MTYSKLLEYAEADGLTYVNVNSGMTSEDEGLLSRYSADGVHLLGEGYSVWAKAISQWVDSVSDDSRQESKAVRVSSN